VSRVGPLGGIESFPGSGERLGCFVVDVDYTQAGHVHSAMRCEAQRRLTETLQTSPPANHRRNKRLQTFFIKKKLKTRFY